MSCVELEDVIDGYFDGEFDLQRSLEIEQHLQGCRDCAEQLKVRQEFRRAIGDSDLYFHAPRNLRDRVRSAVRGKTRLWLWAAPVAAGVALLILFAPRPENSRIEQDIMSAHLRSLVPNHLLDIPSSDNHAVKPWFNGRIDFAPPVIDLKTSGFPLAGARVDYVDARQVAALVYKRRDHTINVFIWPSSGPGPGLHTGVDRGYNFRAWTRGGFQYWTVSDLNAAELGAFADLLKGSLH